MYRLLILNILDDLPGTSDARNPSKTAVIQISFLGRTEAMKTNTFARGSSRDCLMWRKGSRDLIEDLFQSGLKSIMQVEYSYGFASGIYDNKTCDSMFFHSGNRD